MTYDKIVELSNIEKAVFPRKVIPTMELTLDHGLKVLYMCSNHGNFMYITCIYILIEISLKVFILSTE